MTKAELIRKIAKSSGVPDTEAKLFFEIFLRKTAGITELGDALSVPDFGYFIPKKGKMVVSNFERGNLDVFLDLIVFNTSKEDTQDNLIFNVPETNPNGNKPVDAYFSLSIGKPVIPLQGVKDIDFFLPPSGHELRRLIDSKVEKLIDESEIIKNFKSGNDIIIINKNEFDQTQIEMNYNSSNKIEEGNYESEIETDLEDSIDYNEVNWNSSRDLSKEIEEDALLDIGKDYDSIFEDETSGLSWNFGNEADENYYSQNEGTNEIESELKSDELNSESELTTAEINSSSENEIDNEVELIDSGEISNTDDEEIPQIEDVGNVENTEAELESKATNLSYEEKLLKERKSYTWIFILIGLLILAAAYFFVTSMNKKPSDGAFNSEINNSTLTDNNNPEKTKIESAVNTENDKVNEQQAAVINLSEFPKANIVKVSDYIFKYDSIYVVQVSSWKTKEKAVHQVDLFNSSGRNAFLEEAKLGGAVWYRVRVGNFSSLAEAKQFLNKN